MSKFTVGSFEDTDSTIGIGDEPSHPQSQDREKHEYTTKSELLKRRFEEIEGGDYVSNVGANDEVEETTMRGIVQDIIDTGVPQPPDGGWGWVIVGASFFLNLVMDGITSTTGVLLPYIAESLDAGNGQVALAGSLLCGVSLCVGPIVSGLTNKFGCRIVCCAGCVGATVAFFIASLSTSVSFFVLVNGILGGFSFGLMFLPGIVCVSYYFESKRSLATGISVCGSGFGGTFFAPLVSILIPSIGWRGVFIIFAALLGLCLISGLLMRPLEIRRDDTKRPLLMRTENDPRTPLRPGTNSDIPPRTRSMNLEPGVHSNLNLEELLGTPKPVGSKHYPRPPSPIPVPAHLRIPRRRSSVEKAPKATYDDDSDDDDHGMSSRTNSLNFPVSRNRRRKVSEMSDSSVCFVDELGRDQNNTDGDGQPARSPSSLELLRSRFASSVASATEGSEASFIPRIESFTTGEGDVSHVSTATAMNRRPSLLRAVPSSSHPFSSGSIYDSVQLSVSSFALMKKGDEEYGYLLSRGELSEIKQQMSCIHDELAFMAPTPAIVRPMSRKDIFYSGSITHLPEFHTHLSFVSYRQSILNLAIDEKFPETDKGIERPGITSLLRKKAGGAFSMALSEMVDFSLLLNPVFLLLALSGVVGMLGFYLPFVYGIDYSIKQGISPQDASFFISVVGIMNTFGRVFFGMISDLPYVNSLMLNNMCIFIMGLCVGSLPFCVTYGSILVVYIIFGLAVSGFISLTSIILVDLLGLDKLTNAFGLLIFFRGIASIVGTPLAGAMYDAYGNYTVPFLIGACCLIVSSLLGMATQLVGKYSREKIILAPLKPTQEGTVYTGPGLEDIIEEEVEIQAKVQEMHGDTSLITTEHEDKSDFETVPIQGT